MTNNFKIKINENQYIINIGYNIFRSIFKEINKNFPEKNKIFFIIDRKVYKLVSKDLSKFSRENKIIKFLIDSGKTSKTLDIIMQSYHKLYLNKFYRDCIIVGIGGGVIGDLAGFIASTWRRGVDLIHIPTTLLSAVDSCLGGKTAINFRNEINSIGTYYHPSMIFIDTSLILNCPKREINSGMAEVLKYKFIDKFYRLESYTVTKKSIYKIIYRSLKTKAKFVDGDVFEKDKRLFLNFGHTLGHGIESATIHDGKEYFRHGEGVALGIICAAKISNYLGYLKEIDLLKIKKDFEKFNLPTKLFAHKLGKNKITISNSIIKYSLKDKKRTTKNLKLILIKEIGKPFIYETSNINLLRIGLSEILYD